MRAALIHNPTTMTVCAGRRNLACALASVGVIVRISPTTTFAPMSHKPIQRGDRRSGVSRSAALRSRDAIPRKKALLNAISLTACAVVAFNAPLATWLRRHAISKPDELGCGYSSCHAIAMILLTKRGGTGVRKRN
jgi:hypothetical protein